MPQESAKLPWKTKEPFAGPVVGCPPTPTQPRSHFLLTQRTNSLAAMESPQKRQRIAATTMQLISLLPKEVQAGILMWAMEPPPTAAIIKAAIGDEYGESGWWLSRVERNGGYQKHLNLHSPCEALWARVLTRRRNGALAWKWSETNMFVNRTGRAHARGVWADLENEVTSRRNVRSEPPIDQYVNDLGRELHMR